VALAVTASNDALALPRNRHSNRNHWQLVSSVASFQRALPTANMRRMCTSPRGDTKAKAQGSKAGPPRARARAPAQGVKVKKKKEQVK